MQNKVEKNAAQYQKMSDKHDRTSLFFFACTNTSCQTFFFFFLKDIRFSPTDFITFDIKRCKQDFQKKMQLHNAKV